ncbi:MAG: sugar nucleotide-binding protein [Bacteroidales bacterium]|nr:sugar nucleotide-binding protein [Bacteroidales bacterium]
MKFLILGSSGMAGHTISTYLSEQGHIVDGLDRNTVSLTTNIVGDVKNVDLLKDVLHSTKYDSVINCIGILNQFADENKELAVYLNSYIPHLLADITKHSETQIIHMSTDCVFSGRTGKYSEFDFKDGDSFYDRTKALGELNDNKNITFRNSIIGPDLNKSGIGLLNWFMQQNGTIKGYTKAMWSGLTTLELAKVMESAAKVKATGLYNMVYKESISKFDLIQLFNNYLRNNELNIEQFNGFIADKSLVRTQFEFNYLIPNYEKMISELSDWIRKHRQLYPHYNLS